MTPKNETLQVYVNQLHNIQINLCETKDDLERHINNFIDNPQESLQEGLIFFLKNNTNGHPFASILCKVKNKNAVLLIADSLQGFWIIDYQLEYIAQLQKIFPHLEIRFDLTGRQIDFNSCSTDAILYLKSALQCNMLIESTLLPGTLGGAFKEAHEERNNLDSRRYYPPDPTLSFPSVLETCSLFISPIQTFYHSHLHNISQFFDIQPTKEANIYIKKLLGNEDQIKKQRECEFLIKNKKCRFFCNTVLWETSFEFNNIIENVTNENKRKLIATVRKDVMNERNINKKEKCTTSNDIRGFAFFLSEYNDALKCKENKIVYYRKKFL